MASKVLVLNSGSSSLKFKLFDLGTDSSLKAVVGGMVEQIGDLANSRLKAASLAENKETKQKEPIKDHESALSTVMGYLQDSYSSGIKDEVQAIGHRVVHGQNMSRPVLITEKIRQLILKAATLAPLHNPANLQGISAAGAIFPGCPQVIGYSPLNSITNSCCVPEIEFAFVPTLNLLWHESVCVVPLY